jgi:hypothetical protein
MHAHVLTAAGVGAALVLAAVGVPATVGPEAPATAFKIPGARTAAEVRLTAAGSEVIRLNFAAALDFDGAPDLSDDVFVGWQEVGGVSPQPFRVLMPAGCFVERNGRFVVRDFQGCGVEISADTAGGPLEVEILEFDARLVLRRDGSYRFDVVTVFGGISPDPFRAVLGLLGGTAVEIGIASESSMAPPLRAETVSGVEPQPF